MPHRLKNELIEVHVDLPTENYNHSRFDWTGKISEVKFKGISVVGREAIDQPENHLLGKGFYNEFGIDSALGYDQAKPGEWFHKIGVGLLKKEDAQYEFHKLYKIQPANFDLVFDSEKIRIKCQAPAVNGYSYFLEKEICLLKNGFEIKYFLENKGIHPIITNEYNHNFISVNNRAINKNYTLKFPFKIMPELLGENVNPEQLIELGQQKIQFKGSPQQDFFFSNLSGGAMVDAKFQVENSNDKIGISETGNFKTSSINLWGSGHVVCPELFIDINIPAGESMSWSRNYKLYEMDK